MNVAFVLDRSGSMGGEKIALARRAVDHALRLLRSDDRFSLVVYDEHIDVIVESTLATPEACEQARVRGSAAIEARGSTDLCGGWLAGCEQVAHYIKDEALGRCLLLTDGLANQGVTDRDEIITHARELRRRGVVTSTFGVGADFDERLLQQMADAGGGHFYFIERAVQIPDLFASELGEALEVVASGVTLTIETPNGLRGGSPERVRDGRRAGPRDHPARRSRVGAGVVRCRAPRVPGRPGRNAIAATFSVQSAGAQVPAQSVEQVWTFASDAACEAQPRNQAVDEAVGEIYAARAQAEAVELNRQRRVRGSGTPARRVAKKIGQYAGESAALQRAVAELQAAAQAASAPMTAWR